MPQSLCFFTEQMNTTRSLLLSSVGASCQGPLSRVNIWYLGQAAMCWTVPSLSFMNWTSLFKMQGPKVSNKTKINRGPKREEIKMVSQGEDSNQDSNLL